MTRDSDGSPEAVFLDTCVLLNYLNRHWEGDRVSTLLEDDCLRHVISETVAKEFDTVCDRRAEIYPDLLAFLVETEDDIQSYDPDDRDLHVGGNDAGHVRELQYELAQHEGRRQVQVALRRLLRRVELVAEVIIEEFVDAVVEPNPDIDLQFSLGEVIPNSADVKVVCDAAHWQANGELEGEGPLVSLDTADIVDRAASINETLTAEKGPDWELEITTPEAVPCGTPTGSDDAVSARSGNATTEAED
jgi:hypothetical protein